MKDEIYYSIQTPLELCRELVKHIPHLEDNELIFEPFAGEGGFVNALPNNNMLTTEIENGTDYRSVDLDTAGVDWVITNPPYKILDDNGKRVNAFYPLLEYFCGKTNKGVAFLANDRCFSTLTTNRLKHLYEVKGVYIYKIVTCAVKKWRGRYYFVIFKNRCCKACNHKNEGCCPSPPKLERQTAQDIQEEKERYDFYTYLEGNY